MICDIVVAGFWLEFLGDGVLCKAKDVLKLGAFELKWIAD